MDNYLESLEVTLSPFLAEMRDAKSPTLSLECIQATKMVFKDLPRIYKESELFRIRFENNFECGLPKITQDHQFNFLAIYVDLLACKVAFRKWQFTQLFCFHVQTDLRGASLLEIGGFMSKSVTDFFELGNYCGTGIDDGCVRRENVIVSDDYNFKVIDVQKIEDFVGILRPDRIFSTACFEHVFDVDKALQNCYEVMKDNAHAYIYTAPIFSAASGGDHGHVDTKNIPNRLRYGFHLLPIGQQMLELENLGISKEKMREIMSTLHISMEEYLNERTYEYYRRAFTESDFICIRLDEIRNLNSHKSSRERHDFVRKFLDFDRDMTVLALRVLLYKK